VLRVRSRGTCTNRLPAALIETILPEPDGDELKITLSGDLAGTLSAARDSKRSPETVTSNADNDGMPAVGLRSWEEAGCPTSLASRATS